MQIKVCGMREESNIRSLIQSIEPNFMGLIFYSKSPRLVSQSLNEELLNWIHSTRTKLVGVFVEQSIEEIKEIASLYKLDYLQLHGKARHDFEFCNKLKQQGYQIIKVFSADEKTNLAKTIAQFTKGHFSELNDTVDYFLFDTNSVHYGGTGSAFDWDQIPKQIPRPFILAGGLSVYNVSLVQKWIAKRKKENSDVPFALDLNSEFESEPSFKDIHKIQLFINQLNEKNERIQS